MKNLYFTADGIFDGIKSDGIFNGIKSDGSYILETLNLGVHSVAAFIWGMEYEWMLMLFNLFKDNVIDEETGPDEYVRACVEKYGCIEGFCAIFVTENRYYCYSYSPERILVFRRSNLFNLKYTCVEKVEKIQLKRTGYCLYKKTGKTKEGDYYVWFDGYRMISTEVEYLGNVLAMNNIFRSNRLGYKSCRELLHIMRKTHNTHNKNISKNALSMVIISCQGSF